jgi:predicted RNA-binding protein YlqC (UPF0109 family)
MPIPENFVYKIIRPCVNLKNKIIVKCIAKPKNSYYTIGGSYIFDNPAVK